LSGGQGVAGSNPASPTICRAIDKKRFPIVILVSFRWIDVSH